MVKAVECGMISALLNQGWTSLENGLMINGNIALMEQGAPVEAVSVGLQIEAHDRLVFLIAPDVVRFHRFKFVYLWDNKLSSLVGIEIPKKVKIACLFVIDERLSKVSTTALTVWKKSLVFSGNGFTVFHPSGNLLFRVDNYHADPEDGEVLMDATGMPLFTVRRRKAIVTQFQIWDMTASLLITAKNLAKVFLCSSANKTKKTQCDYRVEGCYAKRSFTILNKFNEVVAEVKPKQVRSAEMTLGRDVFSLIVGPGHDQSFIMGFDNCSRPNHSLSLIAHRIPWPVSTLVISSTPTFLIVHRRKRRGDPFHFSHPYSRPPVD